MSAHALLTLLNALGEKDKMRDFANEINKFINTGARSLYGRQHIMLQSASR